MSGYLDAGHFESLLRLAHRAGTSQSVVCLRQMVTKRPIPESLAAMYQLDEALAADLRESDCTFAYDFTVARKAGALQHDMIARG